MKINEVEALVGITKKNIRFYEAQGLLTPRRNSDNGYREYTAEDAATLQRIKLLRKLGVPVGEIQQALEGHQTVGDCIRRHLITLEREKRNLEHALGLCEGLAHVEAPLQELDAASLLSRMDELEQGGAAFRDQRQDVRRQWIAPVMITAGTVVFMGAMAALLLWAQRISPEDAPPPGLIWVIIALFAAVAVGAVLALVQRLREIVKGEIDDAKRY